MKRLIESVKVTSLERVNLPPPHNPGSQAMEFFLLWGCCKGPGPGSILDLPADALPTVLSGMKWLSLYARVWVLDGNVMFFLPLGFNVETLTYKNVSLLAWDLGGRDKAVSFLDMGIFSDLNSEGQACLVVTAMCTSHIRYTTSLRSAHALWGVWFLTAKKTKNMKNMSDGRSWTPSK